MATRDLRVQKTYTALMGAFERLLAEKRFDELTVAELCDAAQVRRATFYKHFSDKYDFFSFYVSELQGRFEDTHPRGEENAHEYFMSRITYLVDFLEEHRDIVASVRRSSLMPVMLDILAKRVEEGCEPVFSQLRGTANGEADPRLVATVFSEALVGTVKWWYLEGESMPREEFLHQASDILDHVLPEA